ncbi:type II toxin-antitoxin system PemK/MazF family toxin [Jiangella rhizosphaerae]|uniref:Type II toxin-antitoxin system PemK/MazF family toxin n=1 Tax=Jiangella rhizosphaerae TaxID=2293569 RepID=A0A418KG42_9ACTN|nr:type II toxin-antitoxin system PemK/MazF family toxin [Jiangella rhizosphaerae]RIQ10838.1 hypothetical protein DY240_31115 [Jiangella rhizosphaerae]
MNPGELWSLEDGNTRLVLSHPTYNASKANLVVTCPVVREPRSFQPFAVPISNGHVLADRLMTHPRHWLIEQRGELTDAELAAVHEHLSFLLDL